MEQTAVIASVKPEKCADGRIGGVNGKNMGQDYVNYQTVCEALKLVLLMSLWPILLCSQRKAETPDGLWCLPATSVPDRHQSDAGLK